MDIINMLPSILVFVLGLLLTGFSLWQIFLKRKILKGSLYGTFGITLTLSSTVIVLLMLNLQTYVQLTRETVLAEIHVGQRTHQGTPVSFIREGKTQVFWINSEEWRVDARFLKWKPWVSILGKDPVVRLESFTGRMGKTGSPSDPVYSLADNSGISEHLTTFLATHTLMADSLFGSSVYMPTKAESRYRISATQAGLVARPVNATGHQAVLDWK